MAHPPVVSVVGSSGSGKTTLIVKLVPELKKRGYRVGTVKHTFHRVDLDTEGKDSWRHKDAGAETALLVSPGTVHLAGDLAADDLAAVLPFFDGLDIVITEGYKRESTPKIEVFRREHHNRPVCIDDRRLVAFVTDADIDPGVPCFSLEAISALADFIEKTVLSNTGEAPHDPC